jgi:hypothetical protein
MALITATEARTLTASNAVTRREALKGDAEARIMRAINNGEYFTLVYVPADLWDTGKAFFESKGYIVTRNDVTTMRVSWEA